MMNKSDLLTSEQKQELVEITQSLIRIRSFSGQEREIIEFIEKKMNSL
jgi:putative aminopeptidase FrvX